MIRWLLKTRAKPASPAECHDVCDSLIKRFEAIHISSKNEMCSHATVAPRPRAVIARYYSTKSHGRDHHHLNEHGEIKQEIIEKRKAFLRRHKMLEDCIIWRDRLIYENTRLYDVDEFDVKGISNAERMQQGYAPVGSSGEPIIIHHLDQTHRSPWVVMTEDFHQTHDQSLHSYVSPRDRVNRNRFNRERKAYWKNVHNRLLSKTPKKNEPS